MYVVILAGGGGTRLRPLSTAALPKPFLPLLDTGETLLQRTVARLRGLGPGEADVCVVAAAGYASLVEAQVPGVAVIVEPEARNTAAAIALATVAIDRDEDDVMVVLPADHRIAPADEPLFRDVLRAAAAGLASHPFDIDLPLVTLGIQAEYAATQYGYLVPELPGAVVDGLQAYRLQAFREKPPQADADVLWQTPGVAWNAGMFLWRRRAIRAALRTHAPDVLAAVEQGQAAGDLAAAYTTINPRSIDYAVMEPAAVAGAVVMGTMHVDWTDIGSWSALLAVLGAPGIEASVIEPGQPAKTEPGDLIVVREAAGLVVREAAGSTMTSERPIALLHGAGVALPIVQALLDRCAAAEARA
ncbi:MAG: sugar phosphate nucleotidyltransferase [Candidatus Limnocylindrales bacterium]